VRYSVSLMRWVHGGDAIVEGHGRLKLHHSGVLRQITRFVVLGGEVYRGIRGYWASIEVKRHFDPEEGILISP